MKVEVTRYFLHSRACLKANLEPFLGFLHSVQYGKPSLLCDLEELYRYLVDDFMFDYVQELNPGDFTTKTMEASKRCKGKREYLNDDKTWDMTRP
jgi:CRISPR/Cas system-associated endonuclease Cas1